MTSEKKEKETMQRYKTMVANLLINDLSSLLRGIISDVVDVFFDLRLKSKYQKEFDPRKYFGYAYDGIQT